MKHSPHNTKEGIAQFDMHVNRGHGIWARECVSMQTPETGQGNVLACKYRKQDKGLGQGRGIRHAW